MTIQLKPDEISALLRRQMRQVDQPVDVAEVDAAALAGVIESAPSKFVASPLGAYREAG